MFRHSAILCAAAVLALSLPAYAHSPLKASTPENGASLSASPEAITLTFGDNVLLTSAMKMNSAGHEDLKFGPRIKAKTFTIADPQLATGDNTVHWKALSADGHVVEGELTFTITTSDE